MKDMQEEPLLFEAGSSELEADYAGSEWKGDTGRMRRELPKELIGDEAPKIGRLGELDCVRHFLRLSRRNVGVDTTFYPLGSCTMKYNPKINERIAALDGFARLHPYQDEGDVEGMSEVLRGLAYFLCEIAGLDAVTLSPAAGAHGELAGLLVLRSYLNESGGGDRDTILIPDSAHGTNPASARLSGFRSQQVKSNAEGRADVEDVRRHLADRVAGMMITNPNTLGLFECEIGRIASALHDHGALLYMDGANMNALAGVARPGDFGVDIMHYNPHKTFSSPHGGGGPGAGPVAVRKDLAKFLPAPVYVREGKEARSLDPGGASIGRVRSFHGSIPVLVRAYAYIARLGGAGVREASEAAVLCANYLSAALAEDYELPYAERPMHEFVLSARRQKKGGVRALDIAKRLLDYGFHPPTVYFPLIVSEALMIEPTETESLATLDAFARAMRLIAQEAQDDPEIVRSAPRTTPVGRLDEVQAARHPVVKWQDRETRPGKNEKQ